MQHDGDRIKLNQILYNLTDNAIKYTPEGGEILVTLRKEEDDSLLWAVRDNGIGIPRRTRTIFLNGFTGWTRPEAGIPGEPGWD